MLFTIRPATVDDISEIAQLFRLTRKHNLPYLPNLHTPEEDIIFFRNCVLAEYTILVANEDATIIGFCAFKAGWLEHLYLLPEYQGLGIGTALLNEAKSTQSLLQLWVFQQNVNAIHFYEKHGFALVKQTDGNGCEEKEPDALYLWSRSKAGTSAEESMGCE